MSSALAAALRRGVATAAGLAGIAALTMPASADPANLPTFDVIPVVNYSVGGDNRDANGSAINGEVRLNGVFTQPLAKGLVFQYEHDAGAGYDTTIGRETSAPTGTGAQSYIYPGDVRDIVDEFRVRYATHGIAVTLGNYYRHRVCCPGVTDPSNKTPAEYHVSYLQLGYATTPIAKLADLSFNYTIHGTYDLHHASADYLASLSSLPPGMSGYTDRDGRVQTGIYQGVGTTFTLIPKAHLTASATYLWGAFDFFDNAPIPYYYTIMDTNITKSFNRYFSLTADLNNLAQRPFNYPFFPPNTIHRAYFAIFADFHVPLSSLVGAGH